MASFAMYSSNTKKGTREMNANELADWLIAFTQDVADYEEKWIKDSATMLRKQQEEIEYWKEMFEKAMKEQEK